MTPPAWLKKAVIYQIFTGRWEAKISANKIIYNDTFNELSKRDWSKLLDLGLNTFYFLGIFDNSGPIIVMEENGKSLPPSQYPRVPSIFAISNHKQLNQNLGTQEEFIALVEHLHELGGFAIVDFVPNHTSIVHPWVKNHPDYYVKNNDRLTAEFSGDVLKLNYENPNLQDEMVKVLLWIAKLGVDGVRCDMAHLVPDFFWKKAIETVKNHNPDFAFIAEAYPVSLFDYQNIHNLYSAGFDAIYNNGLFENTKKVVFENQPIEFLKAYLESLHENQPGLKVNYFFNHDDPPFDNKTTTPSLHKLSHQYLEALLALILFIPDIPFIYNGTFQGLVHRLAHHWFEPLDSKYLEIKNVVPTTIRKLFNLHKQIDRNVSKLEKIAVCNNILTFSNDRYRIALNFSKKDQSLEFIFPSQTGLVHKLTSSSSLPPGKAELWRK
ncbi:MAG: alpha-amylase family glycosyl hydrolase [Patescibacteria group bacterium]|jgi:glycosidase